MLSNRTCHLFAACSDVISCRISGRSDLLSCKSPARLSGNSDFVSCSSSGDSDFVSCGRGGNFAAEIREDFMAPPPPAGAAHRRRGRVLPPVRRAYPLHFVWYFSVWTLFLVIFCPVSPGVDRRRSHMRPVQNLPPPTPSPRGARRSLRTDASRNPEEHPANAAHGCKSESRSFPEPHETTSEFPEPGPQDGARNQVGFHPPPSQADRDRRSRAGGVRTSHEKFSAAGHGFVQLFRRRGLFKEPRGRRAPAI